MNLLSLHYRVTIQEVLKECSDETLSTLKKRKYEKLGFSEMN